MIHMKKYGIVHSLRYPLILCMELQCSLRQQERVAQLLVDIFGDRLFLDSGFVSNSCRWLPSPHDLRGKIIIKVECLTLSFEHV
jgi:phosphatidylinositol phospholipase C, delta